MTKPFVPHLPAARRSRGVGLVTAIFLLVVIAALSVAMVTIYTSQQNSSNLDIQGARAYQAARAGLEWGLFQQRRLNVCGAASFPMDSATSLRGFTVTVACQMIPGPAMAGGVADGLPRWKITATACNIPTGGVCPNPDTSPVNSPDYVRRVVEAQL